MAVKDTKKFLKNINDFVAKEYKRGALDGFRTLVTFTAKASGEGFKEGYADVLKKSPDLPVLTDADFLEVGKAVVEAIAEWSNKDRTKGETLHYVPNQTVKYKARRDFKRPYTIGKKAGSDKIQEILQARGSRKLQGASKENGISPRGSEVGIVKSGLHRAHQGVTTVGAAQISSVFRFLDQTKGFKGFAKSEEARDIWDIIEEITGTFNTTGTKSGTRPQEVSLKEDIYINIDMLSRKDNKAGTEDYDLINLYPKVEKAILKYIESQPIESMSGSRSIEENAEDIVTYMLLNELTKSPRAKVVGPLVRPKGRKKKKTDKDTKGKGKTNNKGSTKTAAALRIRNKKSKSSAMKPLQLIGLINKELPNTVRKNMQLPGLQNRTGKFASSVKVTDVVQTPKGFPSIGYTYDKSPYQVFEMGSGGTPWATPERDPRNVIDRSIREIAAQFAIGRFYTRRE